MRLALACLAMAMSPTTAGADPGRSGPACPSGAKRVELARRAFPDMAIQPSDLVCRVLRARVPTWLITFAGSGCGGLVPAPHGARRIELLGHGHVPDADCPKDGRHVYAWQRGKLIER